MDPRDLGLFLRSSPGLSPKIVAQLVYRTAFLSTYRFGRLASSNPHSIGISGNPPLCTACIRIFSGPIGLDKPFFLATQFVRLQTSAGLGCVLCSILHDAEWAIYTLGSNPDWRRLQHNSRDSEYITDLERPPRFFGCWFDETEIRCKRCLPLNAAALRGARSEDCWTTNVVLVPAKEVEDVMPSTRQLATPTTPEIVADLALKWVGDCEKSHKACRTDERIGSTSPWHPTRLIHVGQSDQLPRLCDSTTIPKHARYVTLSHCWGNLEFLKLKSSNILLLKESIPMPQLIQVFRDAILLTRRLRIDYIWIDSLCIIQDSPDELDWQHESATMGDVYKHAWLNIAATGFSNGSTGLYAQRGRSTLHPQKVNLNIRDPGLNGANLCNGKFYLMDNLWDKDITHSPLNQRAWVFQERLLARRVLHFGARQIYWECNEQEASEIFPCGLPTPLRNGYKESASLNLENIFAKQVTDESLRLPIIWQDIVSGYNAGALTEPTDKLVAISGIAKELGAIFKDEYIAGLWKSHFLQQLLWRAPHGTTHPERPAKYQAPSWSWATINEKVINPSLNSIYSHSAGMSGGFPLATVINPKIHSASTLSSRPSSIFGHIEQGSPDSMLRVRGRIMRAQFLESDKELSKHDSSSSSIHPLILTARKGDQDQVVHTSIEISPELYLDIGVRVLKGLLPLPFLRHWFEMPTWPARQAVGARNFWLLPLWRERAVNREDGSNGGVIEGLVLMLTREARGQYRRLGVFRLASSEAEVGSGAIEEQLEALMVHMPFLDPMEYEEMQEDGESTICIV